MPWHPRSIFGRRAFSVAGLMAWNSLPDSLPDPAHSPDCFRMAAHPRGCEVQSGMSRSPVAVWADDSLPGRWLLPRVRQRSALSTVSWHMDLCGAKNIQQLRRQNFCSRWTSLVELSSCPAAQSRTSCGLFRRQLKGHLFSEPWTRRSVTSRYVAP